MKRTVIALGVLAFTATQAAAGCFGTDHDDRFSVETNAQLAGLAAIEGHAQNQRTRRWDDIQRLEEFSFQTTAGSVTVQGSLSGHSYADAVRRCEGYQNQPKTYRSGFFGNGDVIATINHDYVALTCDGDDAFVATPTGQIFVVDRQGITPHTGPRFECRR